MASLKTIRRRLKSVNNTKKITYAMKLVSAAKLRRVQEAATRSRAYTSALVGLLRELSTAAGGSDLTHPFLEPREQVKRVHLIVIGGARGLCGAYNTNINRRIEAFARDQVARNVELEVTVLGRKPIEYLKRTNRTIADAVEVLPEDPLNWPTDEVCQRLEQIFVGQEIDELYVLYTKFKSAISMTAVVEQLLPIDRTQTTAATNAPAETSTRLFEPSPFAVLSVLLPRFVRSVVRQAALDAKASEHASRMTAMDAATKNASDLIYDLTLTRNKLRQSGITSQLLDIIGGAEALT